MERNSRHHGSTPSLCKFGLISRASDGAGRSDRLFDLAHGFELGGPVVVGGDRNLGILYGSAGGK